MVWLMHLPGAPLRSMENVEEIEVSIVFALPDHTQVIQLKVKSGTTLARAIELSGILNQPDLEIPEGIAAGVYGKKKTPDYRLQNGDRIEIYRPLKFDPKEARRRRAGKMKNR